MTEERLLEIIEKLSLLHNATAEEIAALLTSPSQTVQGYLFRQAAVVKESVFGRDIYIRAIIEFSNVCRCSCRYCGIRRANQDLRRYCMTEEEIISLAREAIAAGYQTIVLQSGEDSCKVREMLGAVIREIKAADSCVAVTLSVGERSREDYAYWRSCGANRYLIKHETADEELYAALHPNHTLKERLHCQQDLLELGYELGSGFMVGLPGQTVEMLAQDLLLLQKMQVSMAGIGPFIPHPQTPLAKAAPGDSQLTQRVLAVARLLLPRVHLPATTALTVRGGRAGALAAGADVIMQKATPASLQQLYEIYPRQVQEDVSLKEKRRLLVAQLAEIGYCGI